MQPLPYLEEKGCSEMLISHEIKQASQPLKQTQLEHWDETQFILKLKNHVCCIITVPVWGLRLFFKATNKLNVGYGSEEFNTY